VTDAGIGLSAVGPITIHLARAEEMLRGKQLSDDLLDQVAAIAAEDCAPVPDQRGPVDYKRHLAGVLTKRALTRAAARARGQEV
jgi:aerobic carbon-monoxide dehydrogenase medium subunit